MDGVVHHFGAVEERFDGDALGQCFLDLLDAFFDELDDRRGIFPFEHHQYCADGFPFVVVADCPVTVGAAEADLSDIADAERAAAGQGFDYDVFDIGELSDEALAADEEDHWAFFDVGAAGVLVVVFEGGEYLVDGEAVGFQSFAVDVDLVLFDESTEAAHVGHALDAQQLSAHDPILDGAQFGGGVTFFVAGFGAQDILVDLAEAGGHRGQFRRPEALGDVVLGHQQPFADLLARPVHVDLVVENDGDDRQAEPGKAADLFEAWDVAAGLFDGEGNQAFHVWRSEGGRDRDDLYLIVGDVRHRIDGQLRQLIGAVQDQRQYAEPDDELVFDGQQNDMVEHVAADKREKNSRGPFHVVVEGLKRM
jgi:hypothetical protein